MHRREFIKAASAACFVVASDRVSAQTIAWPNRAVRLIIPYAPGGATDTIGRPWANALSNIFGQPFVVENRGGAAGEIGAQAVATGESDGYTFLLTAAGPINLLPAFRKTSYDPQTSFKPVGRIANTLSGWAINPSVGPKTFEEMVAYARANPNKLAYGSAGIGSLTHLRLEKLKHKLGVQIRHVPYTGSGQALIDLLANNIQLMAEINVLPFAQQGKLTLLAMGSDERTSESPAVPTLKEIGYGDLDMLSWYAIWARSNVPEDIVARIHEAIGKIAESDSMKKQMQSVSAVTVSQSRAATSAFLSQELRDNAELIRAADIRINP